MAFPHTPDAAPPDPYQQELDRRRAQLVEVAARTCGVRARTALPWQLEAVGAGIAGLGAAALILARQASAAVGTFWDLTSRPAPPRTSTDHDPGERS